MLIVDRKWNELNADRMNDGFNLTLEMLIVDRRTLTTERL